MDLFLWFFETLNNDRGLVLSSSSSSFGRASLCLETTSHFARGTKSGGGLFLEIDDGKEGAILIKISDNPGLKK